MRSMIVVLFCLLMFLTAGCASTSCPYDGVYDQTITSNKEEYDYAPLGALSADNEIPCHRWVRYLKAFANGGALEIIPSDYDLKLTTCPGASTRTATGWISRWSATA